MMTNQAYPDLNGIVFITVRKLVRNQFGMNDPRPFQCSNLATTYPLTYKIRFEPKKISF